MENGFFPLSDLLDLFPFLPFFPAPVVFEKLQSTELYLPPTASIAGETIGMRLMNKPKIVYDGTITIKGALRVGARFCFFLGVHEVIVFLLPMDFVAVAAH